MASHYVRELLAIQPSGPYRLGGYCLRGVIAFEMAQQLQAQGKQVDLVTMLETYNPSMVPRSKLRALSLPLFLQDLWFHGANFWFAGGQRPLGSLPLQSGKWSWPGSESDFVRGHMLCGMAWGHRTAIRICSSRGSMTRLQDNMCHGVIRVRLLSFDRRETSGGSIIQA